MTEGMRARRVRQASEWPKAMIGQFQCYGLNDGRRRVELVVRDAKGQPWGHHVDIPADIEGWHPVLYAMDLCSSLLLARMRRAEAAADDD